MASLSDVPDEIVHHILFYVSHFDNLDNVQLLSRRFNHIANEPLLWRYHCRTTFYYWHASHNFPQKLRQPVSEVDWKDLWLSRMRRNARISKIFDNLLVSNVRRMSNMEKICMQAYDAKDFLLEQSKTDESADDVLARR
jgi:F-box protein 21